MGTAPRPILTQFHGFTVEGEIVGRLLTGYANLEVDLLNCVAMVLGDYDVVLKAMFGVRGEKRRMDKGEKLGQRPYDALGLGTNFQQAIEAMRHCLCIRNQYSHWVWWNDHSGKIAFANLEDVARSKSRVKVNDLRNLKPHHVDATLLSSQEAYFAYTDQYLAWVNYEGRHLAGTLARNPVINPPHLKKPDLRLP
jgi:hypothetical protein